MVKRIFVDVDDTLNEFTMFALRLLGCPKDSVYPNVGYDIVAAYNQLRPNIPTDHDFTPREFWATLPERAWSDAPPSPECSWLLSECASLVGQDNVFLCTSATGYPTSLSGKLKWIQRYLPTWIHRQYVITPYKDRFANPQTLLIDDAPKQCQDFYGAGGAVIMVPQPWNGNSACRREAYIRASLDCYK